MTISCCRPSAPFGPYPNVQKSKKKHAFFYIYIGHSSRRWSRFKISGKKIVKKCTNLTQKFYIGNNKNKINIHYIFSVTYVNILPVKALFSKAF